jgi:hypothetical protein
MIELGVFIYCAVLLRHIKDYTKITAGREGMVDGWSKNQYP